jgi:hypothetical protein
MYYVHILFLLLCIHLCTLPTHVTLSCPNCNDSAPTGRKKCKQCKQLLHWTCTLSHHSGIYNSFFHHKQTCEYCSPRPEIEIKEEKEANKENINSQIREDEKSKQIRASRCTHAPTCMHRTQPFLFRFLRFFLFCVRLVQINLHGQYGLRT